MIDFLGNPPFFTFVTFILCIFLALIHPNLSAVCLLPSRILPHFELQRIFLSPFFHLGFFHILFNMIFWLSLVRDFEHTVGSLSATYTILVLLIPLNALIHLTSAFSFDALFGTNFTNQCSVGVSGILFSTLVANMHISGNPDTSIFGLFSIPALWYPLFLALFLQIFVPNISLLGHLAGIATGHMLANGWLSRLTPSSDAMESFEERCNLFRLPAWQPVPSLLGNLLGAAANALLPTSAASRASSAPSIAQRIQAAWRRMISRMTSDSSSPAPAAGNAPYADARYASVGSRTATAGGAVATASSTTAGADGMAPFSGSGRALGSRGDVSTPASTPPAVGAASTSATASVGENVRGVGRVPPNSRLLQMDEQRRSRSTHGDTSTSTNKQPTEPPRAVTDD